MMNFYIVGHVVSERLKTDALANKLSRMGAKKIMPSLWILKASGTVRDLELELKIEIDPDDDMFIAAIASDCQYRNLLISKAEIQAFLM